ncbi:MAG TPA: N-acetylmuramoyl-L-alanine amidase [Candidatus Absconditabacterales bacterium]|nr:N-acetylmuramoyl-L-alanine amidase [Candidatus Absconditabacterales bacterium]
MKNILKYLFTFSFLSFAFGFLFASDRDLPGIEIISRAERGADETMRLESNAKFQGFLKSREKMEALKATDYDAYIQKYSGYIEKSYHSQMANDYLKQHYFDEIDLDWTNRDYNGDELRWPEYHKNNKTKIIVHHTASDNSILKNKSDVLEYLSGVYRYHTINNGRGDIGYNFIIDPFGNIYEGRAGGEGVVGAHAKRNNTPSVGISLIGNFENVKPTKEALDTLVKLSAAIAKKYNINPYSRVNYHRDSKDAPYIVSSENYVIAGHRDAGITACPGKYLYDFLPYVREGVKNLLEGKTLVSADGLKSVKESITTNQNSKNSQKQRTRLTYNYFESMQNKIAPAVRSIKNQYLNKKNISVGNKEHFEKLKGNINKTQAELYLQQDISVLLYELTQEYNRYDISCDEGCVFVFDQNRIESNEGYLEVSSDIYLTIGDKQYNTERLVVYSKNGITKINNYQRKSYADIPRNSFRGKLIFKKDFIKDLDGDQKNKFVVINKLPFSDYMKGIVETNDTESTTKNEVMSLISKSYALFYMSPENIHPNIPSQATYNAVDDSRIFQKYVGAGLEKTLTKRFVALEKTKNKLVTYNNQVVVLPYFSCSAGFTYSASEKRGWSDTPYLKSKFDLGICSDKDFSGHGVGLSGLGAERRTKFGRSYQDILKYYYPGIEIENL